MRFLNDILKKMNPNCRTLQSDQGQMAPTRKAYARQDLSGTSMTTIISPLPGLITDYSSFVSRTVTQGHSQS